MKLKIGVLGSGDVGTVLANGFLKYGYDVMRGSRDAGKLKDWYENDDGSQTLHKKIGNYSETAQWADLIVLAVKGSVAEQVIQDIGAKILGGKTIVDATNPIADRPPVNGVLQFFTGPNDSLMERLQKRIPEAHFVKAFNSVGNPLMINPEFAGVKPTMFICGNELEAKKKVTTILTQFGWEAEDMGTVEAARAIEPLCMLWCIRGFKDNKWNHAFKLLRQ